MGSDFEARHLVQTYYSAKDEALVRLRDAAARLGADVVVDARHRFHQAGIRVDVTLLGTAVDVKAGADAGGRDADPLPVYPVPLSQTVVLLDRGHVPVGYVLGFSHRVWPVRNAHLAWP